MKKRIEVYQLFPHSGYLMHSYLIKTPNDKIVMIDGGNTRYMTDAYLPTAIRAVLGLNDNDYFEIEAWFISHAHDDHYGEFIMMMKEYSKKSNYKVNNFYFDFPDFTKTELKDYSLESLEELKSAFDKYAEVNGIKCHNRYFDSLNGAVIKRESVDKGLTIVIDGVDFEILMTHADVDEQVNANSTVIRISLSGAKSKTCIFLNDATELSGDRLVSIYGNKLKSDIVQMAHHGQAGVKKSCYDIIDAELRLWPTPKWVWTQPGKYRIGEVRDWFGVDESKSTKTDLIGCLYARYPENYRLVDDWKDCLDEMKVVIEEK